MPSTVLLSLSGGADSATLLARYIEKGYAAEAVFFNYGSKQNALEADAAKAIAAHYAIPLTELDLCAIFAGISCAMMADDPRSIPRSGYDQATMNLTVVPGRNTIFASILAGLAESRAIGTLALGAHGGDHHLYADCRPDYAVSLGQTVALSTQGKVRVETPFITMSKADIIGLGLCLAVPYALTRSCYTADAVACGACGTCIERRDAFRRNGLADPAPYAR